ncbi:Aldehyde/histidinol dehydrogenase [Gautieria morchelliformis]|nr:Aldehyde/histidinol dehydrogenase [Gautieria morchelliformis]
MHWRKTCVVRNLKPTCLTYMKCVVRSASSTKHWGVDEGYGSFQLEYHLGPTIRKEPVGRVVIITLFMYISHLDFWTLGSLVGAISAGYPTLIKPSKLTPATSSLMAEISPKYLDQDVYRIVNGGLEVATKVLELKGDHILHTGSGLLVLRQHDPGEKHLSSLTDLKVAARRILWGKFMNAGQTCIAPDYVLLPESIKDSFVKEFQDVYKSFHPAGLRKPDSFGHIISEGHLTGLKGYLDETKGENVFGGEAEHEDKYLEWVLSNHTHFWLVLISYFLSIQ